MSGQLKRKPKKRNVKGRKPPQFGNAIATILEDCTLTLEEMMEGAPEKTLDEESGRTKVEYNTLPPECTVVDSLNGHWIFKDERLSRHFDSIRLVLNEFGEEFFSAGGASLMNLRYDRKGRVWDSSGGQLVCGLAYLAIGMNFAEWTSERPDWKNLPDGIPYVKFKEEIKNGDIHVHDQ